MNGDNFKSYDLVFSGLSDGKHEFDYEISKKFFDDFGYTDLNDANVSVKVELDKRPTLLSLDFKTVGSINVNCDVSNEPFDYPLDIQWEVTVKFGNEFNNDDDDIIVIPHGAHKVNLAQQIYDWLVLSLPTKRVHFGIEDGTLNSEMVDLLDKYSVKEKQEEKEDDSSYDERWDKLKELLNKN